MPESRMKIKSLLKEQIRRTLALQIMMKRFLAAQSLHLKLPGRQKGVLGFFAGIRLIVDDSDSIHYIAAASSSIVLSSSFAGVDMDSFALAGAAKTSELTIFVLLVSLIFHTNAIQSPFT